MKQFNQRHLTHLKSGDQAKRFLERSIVEAWGERDAREIKKRDVLDLLDEIVDSGRVTTANRVRAHMNKLFNWAVERDIIAISPMVTETRRKIVERLLAFGDHCIGLPGAGLK